MSRPTIAKEPLRQAALALFVEKGVHGASIRDIAKGAGVSEAALYRHWANKDALVLALYCEHLAEVTALLDAAIQGKTLVAAIHDATAAAFALYDREPLVFRFVLHIQHGVANLIPPGQRTPHDVVIDLVRAAMAKRDVLGDPVLLGGCLVGLFLQTATYVQYGRLPGPLAIHTTAVVATAMRVLGQTGESQRR